jgi:hypothetical protein
MANILKALDKLLDKFLPKFLKAMSIDYGIGSAFTITTSSKKSTMSPLNLNQKDQKANINIISDLVKGVNDDMAKKINYLTNKGITEGWSGVQLAEELKGIFDKDSTNYFDYKNRFKTISRTESTRLMNSGAYKTAKQLGATGKYIFNMMDSRTGEDSKVSQSKFGNEKKAIPIDDMFTYTSGKNTYTFLYSPDRPNDRSIVVYTYE